MKSKSLADRKGMVIDMDNKSDKNKRTRQRAVKPRSRKETAAREKTIMLSASVLVLGALTATGIWIGQKNQVGKKQRIIDFSLLEEENSQAGTNTVQKIADQLLNQNDLDVDPDYYEEYTRENASAVTSEEISNPGLSGGGQVSDNSKLSESESSTEQILLETAEAQTLEASSEDIQEPVMTQAQALEAKIETASKALSFDTEKGLSWPIVGNVLINYSMDGYVYFPTLQQYRYSPAIVIEASKGEAITAAAKGIVSKVYNDDEIGNAVTCILGSGYELTYGQLADVQVEKGDYVEAGDLIGYVADPTKYYTLEGANVYFAMTRDGEPVNPLTLMGQ